VYTAVIFKDAYAHKHHVCASAMDCPFCGVLFFVLTHPFTKLFLCFREQVDIERDHGEPSNPASSSSAGLDTSASATAPSRRAAASLSATCATTSRSATAPGAASSTAARPRAELGMSTRNGCRSTWRVGRPRAAVPAAERTADRLPSAAADELRARHAAAAGRLVPRLG